VVVSLNKGICTSVVSVFDRVFTSSPSLRRALWSSKGTGKGAHIAICKKANTELVALENGTRFVVVSHFQLINLALKSSLKQTFRA
jgi:hypothetical protein